MAAPINNKNAETWTLDEAIKVFNDALDSSKEKEDYHIGSGQNITMVKGFKFHYLGEIASDKDLYLDLYKYLNDKFDEIKPLYKRLKTRLESNCFSDSKKGIIKEASAIMNLKSNYGWTDRSETKNEHSGKITITRIIKK